MSGLSDRFFMGAVVAFLLLACFVCLFPLLFVVSVSITPFEEVLRHGGFLVIPRRITFEAYREFMTKPAIPRAFLVTVHITTVGTTISLALTVLMSYALSKAFLPGRKFLLFLVLLPMIFSSGLIPRYLVVKSMGLLNTTWAMILPMAVQTFNVLVMRTFFEKMERDLFDAAEMDGAGEFTVLLRIVIPLSVPVIATIGLFYAVHQWNSFLAPIIYVSDPNKHPIQVVLRTILVTLRSMELDVAEVVLPEETLKMAAVVLATIPMIVVYPFIQKYFRKGALLGSIKG